MYTKIVVGHDLHDGGSDALALGRVIAQATGARLVVAGVFPIGDLPHGFEAQWREQEEKVAREIQAVADRAGAEAEAFPSSSPARGLHDLATEIDADLVVIGSTRHSKVGEILAGNVALGLLHGAPCAVAVAPRDHRKHAEAGLRSITVGFDGSRESEIALRAAVELARRSGAALKLVAVVEPPPFVPGKGAGPGQGYPELTSAIEKHLKQRLDEGLGTVPDAVEAEGVLATGEPAQALADAVRSEGSVLVVGSRAYGPLRRVLLGSVSTALIHAAPCPLIIHPRGSEMQSPTPASAEAGSAA
jgi:nucleotide-binding universal stress UspA family protein